MVGDLWELLHTTVGDNQQVILRGISASRELGSPHQTLSVITRESQEDTDEVLDVILVLSLSAFDKGYQMEANNVFIVVSAMSEGTKKYFPLMKSWCTFQQNFPTFNLKEKFANSKVYCKQIYH